MGRGGLLRSSDTWFTAYQRWGADNMLNPLELKKAIPIETTSPERDKVAYLLGGVRASEISLGLGGSRGAA